MNHPHQAEPVDAEGPPGEKGSTTTARSAAMRILVLAAAAGAFGAIWYFFRDQLSLESLAAREKMFDAFRTAHPIAVYLVAFVIYAVVTGLSVPGASILTIAYGWFFRFWPAVVLVSFASTTGATIAFLLSRYLLRDIVQRRFGDRLAGFNQALEREGAYYLFTLRLIPAVPFFVINVVMGLTPVRVWTYWWISQIGMIAGTCVYVFAGSSVPTAAELVERGVGGILNMQIVAAFVLLAVFPYAVRTLVRIVRRKSEHQDIEHK